MGVARIGGVEAGRVEDLDAHERGERQAQLDAPDRRRVDAAQGGAQVAEGDDALARLGAVDEEDLREGIRRPAQMVQVAVVGSTPVGATSAPMRALMKVLLPALNSPTIARRTGRDRSAARSPTRAAAARSPTAWAWASSRARS